MSSGNREYLSHRRQAELAKAATCEDNAVARLHLQMADHYERRLDQLNRPEPIATGTAL